jgi:hypothetical protein
VAEVADACGFSAANIYRYFAVRFLTGLNETLIVFSQTEPQLGELLADAAAEQWPCYSRYDALVVVLLLASGAPILVVPSGWKSGPIGKKILVGWNASRHGLSRDQEGQRIRDRAPRLAPTVTPARSRWCLVG